MRLLLQSCAVYVLGVVDVFGLSCIVDLIGSRLLLCAVLPDVLFLLYSCCSELTFCSVMV
jgi:hypothetical protein